MRFISVLLAGAVLSSPALAAEKSYDFKEVSKIDISGTIKLEVGFGAKQSIMVEEPDGKFEHIELSQEGDTLKVETDWSWRDHGDRPEYTVKLVLKSLDSLEVSGAIKGDIVGVKAQDFVLDLSGASKLRLSGSCASLDADLSGASKVDAAAFKCGDVKIDISGAGKASVYASESIEAEVAGAGKIEIHGNPKSVEQEVSGAAKIEVVKD